jgi:TolB protein
MMIDGNLGNHPLNCSRLKSAMVIAYLVAFLAPAVAQGSSGEIAFLRHSGSFYQIWIMDRDGSNTKQLSFSPGDKANISWSPDGKQILFNTNMGELYILNLKTGQTSPLDIGMQGMTDAEWSPDGKSVLFSLSTTNSIDTNDIWLVAIADKSRRKVTHMAHLQHHPVWADQGSKVLFLSGKGDDVHDIWLTDINGRAPQQMTFSSGYNFEPDCSVANQIAFSSNRSGNYELYTMNLQGANVKSVAAHPGFDSEPDWGPAGKSLVFVSNRSGRSHIWKILLDGGRLTQLTRGDSRNRTPKWRPR